MGANVLNTFLDGLAELGVDKRLIKNKKILSDLLEKEKVYRETKGKVMMTVAVATLATAVKARKVILKAMTLKVIASLT